ncbi:potassium channel family protein [Luedemannella flava]
MPRAARRAAVHLHHDHPAGGAAGCGHDEGRRAGGAAGRRGLDPAEQQPAAGRRRGGRRHHRAGRTPRVRRRVVPGRVRRERRGCRRALRRDDLDDRVDPRRGPPGRRVDGSRRALHLPADRAHLRGAGAGRGLVPVRPGRVRPGVDGPPSASDLLYLSVITLCTVGYGDITPVSGLARALVVMESLIGQLYLVSIVAAVIGGWRVGDAARAERAKRIDHAAREPGPTPRRRRPLRRSGPRRASPDRRA